MARNTKKSIVGVGVAVAAFYKIAEAMEFTKPAVAWVDKHIGEGNFVELMLFSLVVYLVVEGRERQREEPDQSSVGQTVDQRVDQPVSQQVSPSVTQSPVLNIYPPPEPAKKEKSAVGVNLPRKRTLRVFGKKARIANLSTMGDALYEPEEVKEGPSTTVAVIAEFRNEPGEFSVTTWREVLASIVFFDENGNEIGDVGRAGWLDNFSPILNMESYVTYRLILAVRGSNDWFSMDGNGVKRLERWSEVRRAKVILHDNREFSVTFTVDMSLTVPSAGSLVLLSPPQEAGS